MRGNLVPSRKFSPLGQKGRLIHSHTLTHAQIDIKHAGCMEAASRESNPYHVPNGHRLVMQVVVMVNASTQLPVL